MIILVIEISAYEQLLVRFQTWLGVLAELGGILREDHV